MTSVAGTFDFSDNDAPSPAGTGNHRLSVGSGGAVQVTDPSGATKVLSGAGLPIVTVVVSQPALPGSTYYLNASGITLTLPAGNNGDTFAVLVASNTAPATIVANGIETVQNENGQQSNSILLPTVVGGFGVFYTWTFTPLGGGIWVQVARQDSPTAMRHAWLPQLAHGGGPLAAEIGRAYSVQANGVLTFPLPANLVEGQRVAFIKNYAGAGPTLDTTGGPNLVNSVTGAPAPNESLTAYGPNTLLEYAYRSSPALWQLISKVVARPAIIESGSYLPTLTGLVNIASFTAFPCQWMRVGNVVTVSGKLDVANTLASGTFSALSVSLPVPSAFVDPEQCGGTAHSVTVAPEQHGGFIAAVTGEVFLEWLAPNTANASWSFTFTYQIL
jgi:hypothetical protein